MQTPATNAPHSDAAERALGDFTTAPTILGLVPLAIVIGVLGAGVSLALLDMIGFFTNPFYFQRLSVYLVSPYGNTMGSIAVLVPVGGGLIVGLMARFGSEQIHGHGIPKAMERILINGSKVQRRLAILKPISSAIGIGAGGPIWRRGTVVGMHAVDASAPLEELQTKFGFTAASVAHVARETLAALGGDS